MPLPWIIQVIPRAGHVIWIGFLADFVFWAFLALLASVAVTLVSGRNNAARQIAPVQ
jgi:hypothetical protein